MLELLLFRHAKSEIGQPGQEDHNRDLVPRGEEAAARIGRLIADRALAPDLVLCSTARRARRTWELASGAVEPRPPVEHLESLYMAPPRRLLETAERQASRTRRLMLVGHNPGLHGLALKLAGRGEPGLRANLALKLPTAALVWIGFAGDDWGKVAFGSGELLGFWQPRDLAQEDRPQA